MLDSSTLPTEDMILEVPLNPLEQELLRIRQKHMEQLHEKKISWVEMIKHSFFFTTNQDMMKIAILNSYRQNEVIIPMIHQIKLILTISLRILQRSYLIKKEL